MANRFRNILVVVKQTPYEQYMQMKAQGKAPVALRWGRLKNRYEVHQSCVSTVTGLLNNMDVTYSVVGREELHRNLLLDKDLVIAVGGDGTVLSTSCFLDSTIPVLGVNSDPTLPEERGVAKTKDERRSRGALCATSANNVKHLLPKVVLGDMSPAMRTRIQCIVKSTYTETRLPPALNDVLVAHPSPAAVSRFRLSMNMLDSNYNPSFQHQDHPLPGEQVFSYNCWSSGMWVCTATGSTGAMAAAGGHKMDVRSKSLQFMVREHLQEHDGSSPSSSLSQQDSSSSSSSGSSSSSSSPDVSHGELTPSQMLHLRWGSQHGKVFVDGHHNAFNLTLGDDVYVESHAPELQIFEAEDEH
jgi:NAD+ kinase